MGICVVYVYATDVYDICAWVNVFGYTHKARRGHLVFSFITFWVIILTQGLTLKKINSLKISYTVFWSYSPSIPQLFPNLLLFPFSPNFVSFHSPPHALIKVNLCYQNIFGCVAFHFSIVNLSWAILLENVDLPLSAAKNCE